MSTTAEFLEAHPFAALIMKLEFPPSGADFSTISQYLSSVGHVTWAENPKLFYLLDWLNLLDLIDKFLEQGLTDWWFPFRKGTLQNLLDAQGRKRFLDDQYLVLDDETPISLSGEHFAFIDSDHMGLDDAGLLGVGGCGEVHRVVDQRNGELYAKKYMLRPLNRTRHRELMDNFKREVYGMRRVKHRHCVDLVASCTDMDSVILLSSPVADMDLAKFLDANLEPAQMNILHGFVGCITSALAYLHELGIRHDDLKPNNILIHGSNVLLTDFGFCLDSSDSAMSTTVGRAAHCSRRYSAPEVFAHEPRNRLTDIWGLGCVLFEILSRLMGHKLSTLKSFWAANGIKFDSFAENPQATELWFRRLLDGQPKAYFGSDRRDSFLSSYVYHILLERDRLLRPTVKQVLSKLLDLDFVYPLESDQRWVAVCCSHHADPCIDALVGPVGLTEDAKRPRDLPLWPVFDPDCLDSHLDYILLDTKLRPVLHHKGLNSRSRDTDDITADGHLVSEVQAAIGWVLDRQLKPVEYEDGGTLESSKFKQQAKKSLAISRVRNLEVWVHPLQIRKDDDSARTVQITLGAICLERQPNYKSHFLALIFDDGKGVDPVGAGDGETGLWTDGIPLLSSARTTTERFYSDVRARLEQQLRASQNLVVRI
ncbi:kinase-like domain-containing protein [Massariosphaeria phaeospora]|uniref:Kinase-like domain-containing protein n=1 Tax=Massariosphaeria phaeospora TaxID=100035 RepID=A0A7C8M8J2_9PLEO|nr:kinase-like domain-containing protein [Massariosphaeria phaeospora]